MVNDRKTQVIVALDHSNIKESLDLIDALSDSINWYKVGSVLFTKEGPEAVRRIKKLGKKVFLDLKFHDIPNTVSGAVENCVDLGIDMFTLHASGGAKMIASALKSANETALKKGVDPPKPIAVTMLTSLNEKDMMDDFSISESSEEIVKKLVSVVVKAKGSGVVASPHELPMIRANFPKELIVITPGVRPVWSESGDQKRFMTPAQAAKEGADFLVIGRPIIEAPNPKLAAEKILEEINF